MTDKTKYLLGIYMTTIMTLGQSAHYIQAWKIFTRKSASDVSLLAYVICFLLILHALTYAILIQKKLLMIAQSVGLAGAFIVINAILIYR